MLRTRLAAFAGLAIAFSTLGMANATAAQDPVLFTVMTGSQEVPPHVTPATGFAVVFVNPNTDTVCVVYSFSNLLGTATAAHIHEAPPGVAGSIVIPFPTPPAAHSGFDFFCQSVAPDIVNRLSTNPGGFYVNVHSTVFPGGEIRGQLANV
jgi:hypothetical protein